LGRQASRHCHPTTRQRQATPGGRSSRRRGCVIHHDDRSHRQGTHRDHDSIPGPARLAGDKRRAYRQLRLFFKKTNPVFGVSTAPTTSQAWSPAAAARSPYADCRGCRVSRQIYRPQPEPKPFEAAAPQPFGLLHRHCGAQMVGRMSGRANRRRYLEPIPPVTLSPSPR
jgi:hypothetical protein